MPLSIEAQAVLKDKPFMRRPLTPDEINQAPVNCSGPIIRLDALKGNAHDLKLVQRLETRLAKGEKLSTAEMAIIALNNFEPGNQ
jgi:hypothetical protein